MIKLKSLLYKSMITEGVYDKASLRCFIMVGGPGSGKSYVVNSIFGIPPASEFTSFTRQGLKVWNTDKPYIVALKKRGIDPKNLGKMTDKIFKYYSSDFRNKHIEIYRKYLDLLKNNRLGVIIDGTGRDLNKVKEQYDDFTDAGYDVYLLFVNTTLDTAQKRNAGRSRVLPRDLVENLWKQIQKNKTIYKSAFGSNFIEINGNKSTFKEVEKIINSILSKPVKNPIGKNWINVELKLKNKLDNVSEGTIASINKSIKISVEIDKTKHAGERQSRHGKEDLISEDDILQVANKSLKIIARKLMLNEIDIEDFIHIHDVSSKLNLIGKIKRKQNQFKLIIITVMKKSKFKPKSGTYSIKV